ncbi:hypothetical protein TIFTF001_055277, partial [Ficus carica]
GCVHSAIDGEWGDLRGEKGGRLCSAVRGGELRSSTCEGLGFLNSLSLCRLRSVTKKAPKIAEGLSVA